MVLVGVIVSFQMIMGTGIDRRHLFDRAAGLQYYMPVDGAADVFCVERKVQPWSDRMAFVCNTGLMNSLEDQLPFWAGLRSRLR